MISKETKKETFICADESLEEKFKVLTNASPDCIKLFTLDNKIEYINPGGLREHRFKKLEDAIGLDWTDSVVSEQRPEILKKLSEIISTKKTVTIDVEHLPSHATSEWCSMTISPVFDPQGNIKYFMGISRDISDRKRAEKELLLRDKKLEEDKAKDEALLQSLGEGIIATDEKGRITKVNKAAEQMLGQEEVDLLGKTSFEVLPCLDENKQSIPKEKRPVWLVVTKGSSISHAGYIIAKDGSQKPFAAVVSPIMLEGKLIGTVAAFRDITREKELEKMRLDLLSLASHQLRTPLSGTKWLIETLKKGIHGKLGKEQSEYIDEIYKINERMTGLVSDMLSALRIESGVETFKTETVSISSIFNTISTTMTPAAEARKISIHFQTEGAEATIATAPEILHSILESLLSNAINYSSVGQEVFVSFTKNDASFIFSVKDSGIGIPKAEQAPIFSRFYRTSNAKTFNTTSSGLGLYIASMLAGKIGGKIFFESEENKGSTFYVRIPLSRPETPLTVASDPESCIL